MKKLLFKSSGERVGRSSQGKNSKGEDLSGTTILLNSDQFKSIGISETSHPIKISPPIDSKIEKIEIPQPPEMPMPSVAKYIKSTKFKAYKSTRPDLLNDVNKIISDGLKKLANEDHSDESSARLSVYKDAFQLFIENFTIYRPFLVAIKHEYDATIESLTQDLDSYATIDSQTEMREQAHLAKTLHIQHAYDEKVSHLEEKVAQIEQSLKKAEKERRSAQQEVRKIYDANVVLQKECDEMRSTCVTLTGSLTRLEEERKRAAHLEAITQQELASYKLSEQKAYAEIERLQGTIQTLEQMQSSMVSADALAQLETANENLRAEMRRLETSHRNVLVRYAALKSVAESAFIKWQRTKRFGELTIDTEDATAVKVDDILSGGSADTSRVSGGLKNEVSKKKDGSISDTQLTTIEKLTQLISDGASPRIILECLLDHVEKGGSFMGGIASTGGRTTSTGSGGAQTATETHSSEMEFRSPWAHFVGMGCENMQVASYMRYSGKIQNVNLSRVDTLRIINEIWAAKEKYDTSCGSSQSNTKCTSISAGSDGILAHSTVRSLEVSGSSKTNRPESTQQHSRPNSTHDSGSGVRASTPVGGNGGVGTDATIVPSISLSGVEDSRPLIGAPPTEGVAPQNTKFEIFFQYYLETKFPSTSMVAEMAYNFVHALKKYSSVSDCRLFLCILEHKLPCEAWSDLQEMVDKLHQEILKENDHLITVQEQTLANTQAAALGLLPMDSGYTSNAPVWKLTVDSVMRVVKRVFLSKGEHALGVLNKALGLDNKGNRVVNITKIFAENWRGNRSLFCEQLRLQYITECLSVERHIMDSIDQFKESIESVTMTVGKLREALSYSDSNKTRIEINQLLSRGCGFAVEAVLLMEAKRTPVHVEDFKKRLRGGLLKKSAPKKNGE